MTYALGVDLGTTYTAAAIHRSGRTTMVDLGTRASVIPSVVFLRDDEEVLTGDAANRRGATDPGRLAREFKRRVGDTTPVLLGGAPYSADALMGRLLRWVVDTVTEREGGPPSSITISHPANWGPYKMDLLGQAISRADLDDVTTITEPEAAVMWYASQERVPNGAIVAVYDLGGGTFDAAVVRKTADGVELLGTPEGIERLGGIDFDGAVFAHVAASLGGVLDELDPDDPTAMAAVARLRTECVEAKEALSADTEVSIPVLLPNVSTEVRLTRSEFEAMVRPPLADSITALRRALRSAEVGPEDLHAVLLAGGSSRIPLVAQLVSAELGRPVVVDSHPKHGVALGAARRAAPDAEAVDDPAGSAGSAGPGAAVGGSWTPVEPDPLPGDELDPSTAVPAVVVPPAPEPAAPVPPAPEPAAPVPPAPASAPPPTSAPEPEPAPIPEPTREPAPVAPPAAFVPDPSSTGAPAEPRPGGGGGFSPTSAGSTAGASAGSAGPNRGMILAGIAVLVLVVAAAVWFMSGDDGDDEAVGADPNAPAVIDDGEEGPSEDPESPEDDPTPADPDPEPEPVCVGEGLCIEVTGVSLDGDSLLITWDTTNFAPSVSDNHAHFFWSTTRPEEAGTNHADFGAELGRWEISDQSPYRTADELLVSNRPEGASEICATAANSSHAVIDPAVFHCFEVPD